MIRTIALYLCSALPAQAAGTFACTQTDRVSLSAEGSMRPVFEGRMLTFTWSDSGFAGDGVFYHDSYAITPLGENGFRAIAENADRSDLFRFDDGILMHTAIVKYGPAPSIQSQVFRCDQID